MKKMYFTCGPSQLFKTVPKHILTALSTDIPSISHRSILFQQIHEHTVSSLKKLLNIPSNFHIFFTGSSLESMERIIQNCVHTYSFHFINGAFSKKFYTIASELHKKPNGYTAPLGQSFPAIETIKINKNVELICITKNETSTGIEFPDEEIRKIRNRYPHVLIAIDTVSSVPYCNIDFSKIDITFFSVQKGFGLPAGLSVLIVNDKAIEKSLSLSQKKISTGSYHNFSSLEEKYIKHQTPETPNALAIYLLGKVCDDLQQIKLDTIRKNIEKKAAMIYSYFDNHILFQPFIKNVQIRSKTTIPIITGKHTLPLIQYLIKNNLYVSSGYGNFKEEHIRIANFPAHSMTNINTLIHAIQEYTKISLCEDGRLEKKQ